MGKQKHLRIRLIFLFATLILLSLSIFSYLRINKLIQAAELVNNTQRVKIVLERSYADLLQAETSQRGYLHAKDTSFLTQLATALRNLELNLNQADSLTRTNQAQQHNVALLKAAVNKRLIFLNNVLRDASRDTLPTSRWLSGKRLMDDVRSQINKMQREQEVIMKRDTAVLDKEAYFTPLFTFILITCSLGFLVIAYFRILAELKKSDRLKSNLEANQAELERTNKDLVQKNEETLAAINRVKESEKSLKLQTRQLEENNKTLQRLNKELELFNYISSHDLQEPLRKIQIFASRIQANENEQLSPRGQDDLHRMQEAAFRMQSLIEDLLAYSQATTTEKIFVNTNLADLVKEVISGFNEEIQSRNARIDATEMCEVRVIPFQFRQLLQNLISNALKFSSPEKPVHIQIKSTITDYEKLKNENPGLFNPKVGLPRNGNGKENAYCQISVCDNGIGFESQYKERIFEIFQRLHSKTAYQGTGIGLAIVKKIVENHDGVIHASSQPGQGTCFDIYIPK